MSLKIVPLTLEQANELVDKWHRHHKPVLGCRFAIGIIDQKQDGRLVGAVIVGRPVARKTPQYTTAEATRLVTDGTKHACSALYAAAARIAREMGYDRIQTFILPSEPGTSLRAAGWEFDGMSDKGGWTSRPGRRTDQPVGSKQRWVKRFRKERI